jgi:type IV pilus assembly protein PilW
MWHGPSEQRAPGRDRGVTLLETLISTALFSLVIAGVYLLYTTMQSTMSRGEMKTDLQQNARVAMDRMVQEIRMAGYDPSGIIPVVSLPPKAAIRAATPACLTFVADVTGSGTARQITYDLNQTTLRRRESLWGGSSAFSTGSGAQPQAESVSLLTFTYYDAFNQVITPAAITSTQRCPPQAGAAAQAITQLDYGQMQQIRRVAITVQTRESRPGIAPEFYTLTNDVRLRNR